MWNLILYVIAIFVGLFLYAFYDPSPTDEKEYDSTVNSSPSYNRRSIGAVSNLSKKRRLEFRMNTFFVALGLTAENSASVESIDNSETISDRFSTLEEVSEACRKAGLERSNLIIGIDFTASNEWQGRKCFSQNCLHKTTTGGRPYNPYQKVIWALGRTLKPFDEDGLIPAFGFGDSKTRGDTVFSFRDDGASCHGFEDVLDRYNEAVSRVVLGGPTSFLPIIRKALDIVKETSTFHILVIVSDGQITEEEATVEAIVRACDYPLSIVVVGVGDGPWHVMEEFDRRLPGRKFDNFHFVDYHLTPITSGSKKAKHPDAAFALEALMEIPDQYNAIKSLGYLDPLHVEDMLNDYSTVVSNRPIPTRTADLSMKRRSCHSISSVM